MGGMSAAHMAGTVLPKEHQDAYARVIAAATEDQTRAQKEIFEVLTKVVAGLFSSAKSYVNVIIIAGYAAFFAIWSSMRATMSPNSARAAALALLISLALFVMWETISMVLLARVNWKFASMLRCPPEKLQAATKQFQASQDTQRIKLIRTWVVFVSAAFISAYIGLGIMAWQFITGLLA
jgi:hypothetical protein